MRNSADSGARSTGRGKATGWSSSSPGVMHGVSLSAWRTKAGGVVCMAALYESSAMWQWPRSSKHAQSSGVFLLIYWSPFVICFILFYWNWMFEILSSNGKVREEIFLLRNEVAVELFLWEGGSEKGSSFPTCSV